jgi:hypothetical protein
MWKYSAILPASLVAAVFLSQISAQQPANKAAAQPAKEKKDYSTAPVVVRLMAYSKKDDVVNRDDVTDERLLRLFDQADTKKEGVVTKEQLMALAAKLEAEQPAGRGGPGGDGPQGRGGPGGPGGDGRGGPGGPGGRGPGGPPQLGVLMPDFVQETLKMTDEQKKKLAELQKETDAKIEKILTDEQKKQYKDMKDNPGRGGPGGRGPGGRGGPEAQAGRVAPAGRAGPLPAITYGANSPPYRSEKTWTGIGQSRRVQGLPTSANGIDSPDVSSIGGSRK